MFARVTVIASDLEASRRFYETVLGALAGDPWRNFGLAQAEEGSPPTHALHVAFAARSSDEVDAFWRAGVDAGYRSDGEPGLRPQYHPDYYGGFLLDPDGNSVEACSGFRESGDSAVDHLWIGVGDLRESLRFWKKVAPPLGLVVDAPREQRFHVHAQDRSFALVADGRPATEHVRIGIACDAPVSPVTDANGNVVEAA